MSSRSLSSISPDELLLHVALLCDDVADVARFARTCTALHTLITHTDHFWSLMLARHFDVHSGDGDDDAVGDHRALFREQCMRMVWVWAPYSAKHLAYCSDARNDVTLANGPRSGVLTLQTAYTERPLPARGFSAFRVTVTMPAANLYRIGVALLDRERDADWVRHHPPSGVLRACVQDSGGFVRPCASLAEEDRNQSNTQAHFVPAGWPEPYGQCGWRSGARVTMVVDADRGRVYYSVGGAGVYLIAFDDERLAHQRNMRAYVTLVNDGSRASIERVRVTEVLRAVLRAVDAEYEASRAGE